MMFRFLAFLSAVGIASATETIDSNSDIKVNSRLGRQLMSKARALNNNNNQDYTWVTNYSIRFEKCATSTDYYGGYFGGNGNNNNNNNKNNNNNRQYFNGMYEQRLVHFKLCPTSSCSSSSCENGADYVIDMNEFVNAYVESKLSIQEYNCERVRENCYCNNNNGGNNNGNNCYYQCYQSAGMDYCYEYQNGGQNNKNGQEFNLQEYVECRRLEVDEDALNYYIYKYGNNNQNMYQNGYYQGGNRNNGQMELFAGPYCSSNGKKIFLGVFMEETCSFAAQDGLYEKINYGQKLPYSKTSLIDSGCVSCKEPSENENQYYYDQQDEDEVTDICERLYEESGKCETKLQNVYYRNEMGCEFIKSLKASGGKTTLFAPKAIPAKVLAGLFAATTLAFAGAAYHMHKRVARSNVNLAEDGKGAMA